MADMVAAAITVAEVDIAEKVAAEMIDCARFRTKTAS